MSSLFDIIRAVILAGLPRSPEDWKSGDLAICVTTKGTMRDEWDPKEHDLLRVHHVCCDGLFLHFEGKPETRHWLAVNFRKVEADTKGAEDADWVDQLQHLRRRQPA